MFMSTEKRVANIEMINDFVENLETSSQISVSIEKAKLNIFPCLKDSAWQTYGNA